MLFLPKKVVMKEVYSNKVKAHISYRNSQGTYVPGVTTVLNELGWNKNILIAWARREALKGNDPDKIRDASADIGTCAHYLCECDAKGIIPDLSEFSQSHIDIAEKCFIGYLDWKKAQGVIKIIPELALISEEHKFGGTIDMLCTSGDKIILSDIKTSNGIYAEHKIQVAAYYYLLLENGYKVDDVYILHLAKNGEFASHKIANLSVYWEVFQHCLALQELHKLC